DPRILHHDHDGGSGRLCHLIPRPERAADAQGPRALRADRDSARRNLQGHASRLAARGGRSPAARARPSSDAKDQAMRHLNFSGEEILETIPMVRTEQLDIRTIPIGISLLDCVSDSPDTLCRNVYEKIERVARNLRRVSVEISEEFGLPIINNRIAVTPVSLIAARCRPEDLLGLAETLARA